MKLINGNPIGRLRKWSSIGGRRNVLFLFRVFSFSNVAAYGGAFRFDQWRAWERNSKKVRAGSTLAASFRNQSKRGESLRFETATFFSFPFFSVPNFAGSL